MTKQRHRRHHDLDGSALPPHAMSRTVVPFPVTTRELGNLVEQAVERGEVEKAAQLEEVLTKRQLQARYAEMAQQDPEAEGW